MSIFRLDTVASRLEAGGWDPQWAVEASRLLTAFAAFEGSLVSVTTQRLTAATWVTKRLTYRVIGVDPATCSVRLAPVGGESISMNVREILQAFGGASIAAASPSREPGDDG